MEIKSTYQYKIDYINGIWTIYFRYVYVKIRVALVDTDLYACVFPPRRW